jgi:Glycosyltransferase family 87
MSKSAQKLTQFPGMFTFVVAAPVLWLIAGIVGLVERNVLHWPKEFWYPFFTGASYSDFGVFRFQFLAFRTPQFWQHLVFPFTYPAPTALAFEAFFSIPRHQERYFLLFIIASAVVGAIAAARALRRQGLACGSALLLVGVAVITSYPFMFLFDRANIEIVNWIFVSLAIAALWCERWNWAGALLGVAISLKLFPFVLLGLFLPRKKFVAALIAIITTVALDIVSLAILGPTVRIANQQIAVGLRFFQDLYVHGFHPFEIPFDHSLFAVVKHVAVHVQMVDPAHLARFADWYMWIAALAALVLYLARIVWLPRVNQIVILLTLSILLPPVSGDYTLVHLYAGWMVLALFAVNVEPGVIRSRVLPACFLILAVVFCPETYLFIGQAHVAGSFKALALSVLVVILLVYPLEEKSPRCRESKARLGFDWSGRSLS